uniref:Uncharacterized protein n=1 Tax=Dromaius novaehollandiae TaxID=8790 RepID=A0A8C4JPW6_DRONO
PVSQSFLLPAKPYCVAVAGSPSGRLLVMEMDDAHERSPLVLMDFAQDLFGAFDLKAKLQQKETTEEEQEPQPQPQLAFMLWQATTLKQLTQWDHLDETLWNLRSLFPSMPAVLVLVLIQPDPQRQPEQTAEALRRMQCLLDGAFQELVVEAAIYSPGQPDGILEVKRAACRALREVLKGREGILGMEARDKGDNRLFGSKITEAMFSIILLSWFSCEQGGKQSGASCLWIIDCLKTGIVKDTVK